MGKEKSPGKENEDVLVEDFGWKWKLEKREGKDNNLEGRYIVMLFFETTWKQCTWVCIVKSWVIKNEENIQLCMLLQRPRHHKRRKGCLDHCLGEQMVQREDMGGRGEEMLRWELNFVGRANGQTAGRKFCAILARPSKLSARASRGCQSLVNI